MSKISDNAAEAFINHHNFKQSNTAVYKRDDGSVVMDLFGNRIARYINNRLFISCCGWYTVITRRRLNAILKQFNSNIRLCTARGLLCIYVTGSLKMFVKNNRANVIKFEDDDIGVKFTVYDTLQLSFVNDKVYVEVEE